MKHAVLATLVAFAGFSPVLQAQGQEPVSQRLMQIDLDVATRHYEKLQGLLRDAKLEQMVGESNGLGEAHVVQVNLVRKIEIMTQLSEETRMEILKLGQALEESGAKLESPNRRGKSASPAPAGASSSNYAPSASVVPGVSSAQAAVQARPAIVVQPQTTPPPPIAPAAGAGGPPAAMPGGFPGGATPPPPVPVPVPPTPPAPAVPAAPGAANPPLPPTAEPQEW